MVLILQHISGGRQAYSRHLTGALGLVALLVSVTSPVHAAIVERINRDKSKVLLTLTQAEMAAVEEDQHVLVEVDKPQFVVSGTLARLNVVKRTIVLELAAPDDRFVPKQHVRFLSIFSNVLTSPIITSYGQYHQYQTPFTEVAAGGYLESQRDKSTNNNGSTSGEKTNQSSSGAVMLVHGYMPLSPTWFGVGLDYERRDGATQINTSGATTSVTLTYNRLAPGLWCGFGTSDWRLGLRYDYTELGLLYRGNTAGTFNYTLGQTAASLVHFTADEEAGIDFISADNLAETGYSNVPGQPAVGTAIIYKAPAQVSAFFRKVESPVFIWGLRGGYIFYNPDNGNLPADPKASVTQLLRLRATVEMRFDDGSKMEGALTYDGGHTKGYSTYELEANEAGINLTYEMPVADRLMVGGEVVIAAGYSEVDDSVASPSGTSTAIRSIYGFQLNALVFVNYSFEPAKRSRR